MERAEYILSLVGTIVSCMAGILTIGIKLIKALKEVKERIKGWEGKSVLSESEAGEGGGRGINDSPDRIPISFLGRNRKYRLIYKLDKTERS